MRTNFLKTGNRKAQEGFTLAEVMVALAIVSLASVMLLSQRVDLVREAQNTRDVRTAWILAAQKISELELDPKLWMGEGGGGNGDFGGLDPAYQHFVYEYMIQREEVPTNDPANPSEKPKEIFRLRFMVNAPALEKPVVVEAFFPIEQAEPEAEGEAKPAEGESKPEGGKPADGSMKPEEKQP
jgi:prepilin-type N-terminal cleavage/methylation domain-containing protein